ncbi:uncharacterized protein LOC130954944 [Arachis stenosperma]|uniref:uncharacterized protein LOC130954944 n=1 Tax=Arachis stenosperma TaxID=217475 RepID=UPI000788CDCD|nr:uncharacterized protein LOC130954944 [Arachis stenosperma]
MASSGNNNKILRETKSMSAAETTAAAAVEAVSSVKCYCCGLTEECTPRYIDRVRERYEGRWICGLCAEAVKEETLKSRRDISTDEALKRHVSFFQEFRSSSSSSGPQDLILAMKQLLLRSLDSSSSSSSPRSSGGGRRLGRSQSCFSSVNSGPTSQPNPHSQNRIVHGRDIREKEFSRKNLLTLYRPTKTTSWKVLEPC